MSYYNSTTRNVADDDAAPEIVKSKTAIDILTRWLPT